MEVNRTKIVLETRNLSIGYKTRKLSLPILQDLSLELHAGDFIALAGKNGSGKSTFIRTLGGLQEALSGQVLLHGKDLRTIPSSEIAKEIAYVSTDWIQVNNLKLVDLVSLGRFPYTGILGRLSKDDRRYCEEALEITGLNSLRTKLFDELSDGEKQRGMIARALAQQTSIILLDEPIAFLDISHKFEIVRMLSELSRLHDKCILFSIHDLSIAMREAGKLWLIHDEQLHDGAPEDFMLNGRLQEIMSGQALNIQEDTGEFYLPRKRNGQVFILGSGLAYQWTIKALERMNLDVEPTNNPENLTGVKVNEGYWEIYQQGKMIKRCNTILELTLYVHLFKKE